MGLQSSITALLDNRFLVCAFFILYHSVGFAQQPSERLPEVLVLDSLRYAKGAFRVDVDSLNFRAQTRALNLSEVLSSNTNLFMKDNGPGMLSTPTYRGGDATHTNLLWNGIRINSPMLGTVDFSEIQTGHFNKATVISGTSTNLFSTGGMGAAINLNNTPSFTEEYASIQSQIGSFGNTYNHAVVNQNLMLGKVAVAVRVSANMVRNLNEFSYINNSTPSNELEISRDSKFNQESAITSISALLSSKTSITFNSWNQRSRRNVVSPVNQQIISNRNQNDNIQRMQLILNHQASDRVELKQVFFYDNNSNHYIDTIADINNNNKYYSIQSLSSLTFDLGELHRIDAQYLFQFTEASSMNYLGFVSDIRNEGKLGVTGTVDSKRIGYSVGSRFSLWRGNFQSMPFASAIFKLSKSWSFSTAVSRTVRIPTLNEVYWNPGGNNALKPEEGNTAELGLTLRKNKTSIRTTAFFGDYENRIRWLPKGSIFSPVNISTSEVYGVELFAVQEFVFNDFNLQVKPIASYLQSLGRSTPNADQHSLTYTPDLLAQLWLVGEYKGLSCSYHFSYTDRRYITSDETAYMPDYIIQNVVINWNRKNSPLSIGLRVNNLADIPFQNMPWFAMPGRNYQFIIQYTWRANTFS